LILSDNAKNQPWWSKTWQNLTGTYGLPWYVEPSAAEDSPAPLVPSWAVREARVIQTFAQNIWSKSSDAQFKHVNSRKADNDSI